MAFYIGSYVLSEALPPLYEKFMKSMISKELGHSPAKILMKEAIGPWNNITQVEVMEGHEYQRFIVRSIKFYRSLLQNYFKILRQKVVNGPQGGLKYCFWLLELKTDADPKGSSQVDKWDAQY